MSSYPKIFVTRRIPEEGMRLLRTSCTVEVHESDRPITRRELLAGVDGQEGILAMLTDTVDAEVMEAAGKGLRVISNYAVGFNNIDLAEATKRGILVTNTPGVLTETTADLAWAGMFAAARRIVEGDRLVRTTGRVEWGPMVLLGHEITGATLGVVGMGRIGRAMARRAHGFAMSLLYNSRSPLPAGEEGELHLTFRSLPDLLREADFVSLHVPLTQGTRHLIGEKELRSMKHDAVLINTARGEVVDEKVLVRALTEGWIAASALDVYEREPEVEPALLQLSNVVLLPHIGSASRSTRAKMAEMAASNLVEALHRGTVPHPVNPEVLR